MLHAQISNFYNRNFIECSRPSVASKKILRKQEKKDHIMQILGTEVEGICVCVSLTKIWGTRPLLSSCRFP